MSSAKRLVNVSAVQGMSIVYQIKYTDPRIDYWMTSAQICFNCNVAVSYKLQKIAGSITAITCIFTERSSWFYGWGSCTRLYWIPHWPREIWLKCTLCFQMSEKQICSITERLSLKPKWMSSSKFLCSIVLRCNFMFPTFIQISYYNLMLTFLSIIYCQNTVSLFEIFFSIFFFIYPNLLWKLYYRDIVSIFSKGVFIFHFCVASKNDNKW